MKTPLVGAYLMKSIPSEMGFSHVSRAEHGHAADAPLANLLNSSAQARR
jgi:hypothetical protein